MVNASLDHSWYQVLQVGLSRASCGDRVRHAELGQRFHWRAMNVKEKGMAGLSRGSHQMERQMINCHPLGQFQSKDWYKARPCAAILLSYGLGPTPVK